MLCYEGNARINDASSNQKDILKLLLDKKKRYYDFVTQTRVESIGYKHIRYSSVGFSDLEKLGHGDTDHFGHDIVTRYNLNYLILNG